MSAILDLYQELIIDHSKAPKNFGSLNNKTHHAHGHNPLCGDNISLDLVISNNQIVEVAFSGDGCAISKASASLMTESIKNKSIEQSKELFNSFQNMLTKEDASYDNLGKLSAFCGVKQFPIRIKCATLSWHTLNAALNNVVQKVSTE